MWGYNSDLHRWGRHLNSQRLGCSARVLPEFPTGQQGRQTGGEIQWTVLTALRSLRQVQWDPRVQCCLKSNGIIRGKGMA